jgi:hypothetical protein
MNPIPSQPPQHGCAVGRAHTHTNSPPTHTSTCGTAFNNTQTHWGRVQCIHARRLHDRGRGCLETPTAPYDGLRLGVEGERTVSLQPLLLGERHGLVEVSAWAASQPSTRGRCGRHDCAPAGGSRHQLPRGMGTTPTKTVSAQAHPHTPMHTSCSNCQAITPRKNIHTKSCPWNCYACYK